MRVLNTLLNHTHIAKALSFKRKHDISFKMSCNIKPKRGRARIEVSFPKLNASVFQHDSFNSSHLEGLSPVSKLDIARQ